MLDYLQDKFNLPEDICYKIKKELDYMDEIVINKQKFNQVIRYLEYYSFLNKKVNKRKGKEYLITSTIRHFGK